MKIEQVEQPGEEWDRFAEAHPASRLGHASAWAHVLRGAYRLQPLFLGARSSGGELRGILPLVRFRPFPGGSTILISLPFLDSAGILATDAEVGGALLSEALRLGSDLGCTALELRDPSPPANPSAPDPGIDRINLALDLRPSEAAQWQALSAKVRNQCRKAEREGLSLAAGDPSRLRREFLEPYETNMRDLGSPPHSTTFFACLARQFGERIRFVVTHHEDRPVGGLVAIRYGSRVYVPWASTLRTERSRCPNNQIYWEAIRWAIDSGATRFDFGRSPRESGTFRFKKGWGAFEEELYWRRVARDGTSTPRTAGIESPVVRGISQIWRRLPVTIATNLGARLRRYFSN